MSPGTLAIFKCEIPAIIKKLIAKIASKADGDGLLLYPAENANTVLNANSNRTRAENVPQWIGWPLVRLAFPLTLMSWLEVDSRSTNKIRVAFLSMTMSSGFAGNARSTDKIWVAFSFMPMSSGFAGNTSIGWSSITRPVLAWAISGWESGWAVSVSDLWFNCVSSTLSSGGMLWSVSTLLTCEGRGDCSSSSECISLFKLVWCRNILSLFFTFWPVWHSSRLRSPSFAFYTAFIAIL